MTTKTETEHLRHVLARIHAAMAIPFEWSPDTPEAVWAILEAEGYAMPDEDVFEGYTHISEAELDLLAPYRPHPYRITGEYGTFTVSKVVMAIDAEDAYYHTGISQDLRTAGWDVGQVDGEEWTVEPLEASDG